MTDPDLSSSATPHQLEPELVAWFSRFRGTQRAARLAPQHPEEFAEATRLLRLTGGHPLSREEVVERWATPTAGPGTGERFRFADGREIADAMQAAARAAFDGLPGRPAARSRYDALKIRVDKALDPHLERARAHEAAQRSVTPTVVEIRRPRWTATETVAHLVATGVGVALTIAATRGAARIFGVELTRRQAFVLSYAVSAMTKGSGYRFWTRPAPATPRRSR